MMKPFAERYRLDVVRDIALRGVITTKTTTTPTTTTTSTTSSSSSSFITTSRSQTTTTPAPSQIPASTAASSSSPSPTPGPSNNVGPGAATGIGIGGAIIGALLAVVILFFMGRRRKSSRSSQKLGLVGIGSTHRSRTDSSGVSKEQQLNDRSREIYEDDHTTRANDNLDNILPQPLADEKIKQEVTGLFTMIDGHVLNFYHEQPLTRSLPAIKDGLLPAAVSAQKDADIGRLLEDPRTRPSAVSSIICAKLLESTSVTGDTKRSLLPPVVTYFLQSLASQPDKNHASQLSLSRWRVSSMLLRGNKPLAGEQEHRQQAIQMIIRDLDKVLGPFVAPGEANKRAMDLGMLSERAAKVGMILLSQPAHWEYTWRVSSRHRVKEEGGQSRNARAPLVVFPGLLRTTDNASRGLDRARSFLDARIVN